MDVNCYHVGALLRKFSDKLYKRNKRSGVVVSSSIAAQMVLPGNFAYCASKVFVRYICEAVAMESQTPGHIPIDIMAL